MEELTIDIEPFTIIGPSEYSKNLRDTEPDFVIVVEDEYINVHRDLLTTASEYFRCLFDSGMQEVRTGRMEINYSTAKIIRSLISYIYGRDIVVQWDEVRDYLDVIECWLLTDLKDRLQSYIHPHISPENCIDWFCYADRYQLRKIVDSTRTVLQSNFVAVTGNSAFLSLGLVELKGLMCKDVMMSWSTDVKLRSCINWVLADEDERRNYFNELMDHIELNECATEYVKLMLSVCTSTMSKCEVDSVSVYVAKVQELILNGSAQQSGNKLVLIGGWDKKGGLNKQVIELDFKARLATFSWHLPEIFRKFNPNVCMTPAGVFSGGGAHRPLFSFTPDCAMDNVPTDCALLDLTSRQFTRLPPVPFPICGAGATYVNGKIYVIGGVGSEHRVQCLDLETLTWTSCADLKQGLYNPIVVSIGHKIYALRQDDEQCTLQFQCYDTDKGKWTTLSPPIPSGTSSTFDNRGACAVAVGADVYVVGGADRLCVRYSTARNRISLLSPPRACHMDGGAVYVGGGKIVVCGGEDNNAKGGKELIEVYDIKADRWRVNALKLPVPTWGHHVAIV